MDKQSSQKAIGRNQPPRVEIEYDVEVDGSEKKVSLPFVMGVMADLSGRPGKSLSPVEEREFLKIDASSFNAVLKSQTPRVTLQTPNTLTGEGNLNVDLTFENLDDFCPAAVARKVDALNKLLEARTELSNLLSYLDGRSDAEEVLSRIVKDPALLKSLTSQPKPVDQPSDTEKE